jgi:inner membrane protease ATP23
MSAFPFFLSSTTTTPIPIPSTPEAAPEAVIIITPAEHKVYHEKCNEYISSGLNSDVTIKFLMEKLISMNCTPPKGFMKCIDCGDKLAGAGFGVIQETITTTTTNTATTNNTTATNKIATSAPETTKKQKQEALERYQRTCSNKSTMEDLTAQITASNNQTSTLRLLPSIFLCQQHLVNAQHAHQSMIHELIHAIDLCRTDMDPISNCIHMACTEIRAENLSGECGAVREMVNGRVKLQSGNFKGHGGECVKRRARLSVMANPNCKERAGEYVDAAFERCFRDTFPFDRHPNLR